MVRLVRGSWLVRDFSPEMVPDAPAEAVRLAGGARKRRRGAKTTTGADSGKRSHEGLRGALPAQDANEGHAKTAPVKWGIRG
jgi:hypothetical protein